MVDGQTIVTSITYKDKTDQIITHQISNYLESGPLKLNDFQKQVELILSFYFIFIFILFLFLFYFYFIYFYFFLKKA